MNHMKHALGSWSAVELKTLPASLAVLHCTLIWTDSVKNIIMVNRKLSTYIYLENFATYLHLIRKKSSHFSTMTLWSEETVSANNTIIMKMIETKDRKFHCFQLLDVVYLPIHLGKYVRSAIIICLMPTDNVQQSNNNNENNKHKYANNHLWINSNDSFCSDCSFENPSFFIIYWVLFFFFEFISMKANYFRRTYHKRWPWYWCHLLELKSIEHSESPSRPGPF